MRRVSGVLAGAGLALSLGIMALASAASAGPKWDLSEDSWMQLSFLGQVHYSFMDDAVDEEDFFLRRGRIILSGQIMDGVKFFAETDNDNAGKNGTSDIETDIQDAFVDLRLGTFKETEHWLKAGLVLLPFSFETRASAASLLGIDYNAETIKFVNTFVWRDYGAELHGNIGKKIAYAVGAFDGYDEAGSPKNDAADLRACGHLAINLIGDVETGWFYSQERLGKSQYLTIGAGYDSQDKATLVGVVDPVAGVTNMVETDSEAWVVDFQSGFKIGESASVTVNGAYYDWDNSVFEGSTAFVEGGLLLMGKVMPTMKWSQQDPDGADAETIEDFTAGLNYFLKGHNVRAGVEYRWGDSSDWLLAGLQFLL
ncbi:MAG: hypothetical protein JXB04_10855 [Kiritimatiellae bacterium]|nr:hypothetical protein [Kiritimatiellia bacterium]